MKTLIIVAPIAALCIGCSSLTSPARPHQLEANQNYWFDYDASRRGTLLTSSTSTNKFKSCAEPAPDVALSFVGKVQSEINYQELDTTQKGELAINVVKLAERSQMVLFFREALYRVCEMSINQDIDKVVIQTLYEKIIDTSLRLGSDKAIDIDAMRIGRDIALAEAAIQEAATKREIALAEQKQAPNKAEEQRLSQEIVRLNEEIKKYAEDKKDLGGQLQSIAAIKTAEAAAQKQDAVTAQTSGIAISQNPGMALPTAGSFP